ncbi:LysM peptidoglycan-binding domain-containing protein [Anaerocolumna xylanovorans]|uniref:LysM domain-containing protein n=1 Tax=Anaerocolumna xylanovorans DSM 12503 TaxID=1121345 RepID=A0A1M7Y6C3_9FIRM|nr:LysM peptidoglycan-binding domain-containing protein [Anaerocolumna xylanovorans]SHO48141.1 LysM domain-containing protein [Anaerocolumna xylanovorans DSM 12503]
MYAIFFDYNGTTYRLPTTPEEISVSNSQAVEKYNVLKIGQIAVPTYMELKEYSFECEFPHMQYSYVKVKKEEEFLEAKKYLDVFAQWRKKKVPVRFLAGSVTKKGILYKDRINTLVLIEEMSISEKAGEEGDKYVSFKLIEYRDFNKIPYYEINKVTGKPEKGKNDAENPKKNKYHIVVSGDTLIGISKKYYGDGTKYTKIYEANKDKIKNPALIHPGWKLVIP